MANTSIFHSDDEEAKEESKPEKPKRGSRKRGQVTEEKKDPMESGPDGKVPKFDPQRFLEQIQNASKLEADRRKSELKIVEYAI